MDVVVVAPMDVVVVVGAVSEMVEVVFQEMRDKFKCDHCDRFEHLKDTCWDLHGHP